MSGINNTGGKFAASINDTSGKLATSINKTGGKFCHQFQNCHRYQRHRRQICHRWKTMGTISGCRYLKVNLKAKIYIYVNSTIQSCPNTKIKIFLIEDFFVCHWCQRHRWLTLSCKFLRKFSKKFERALMVNSGAWGKPIHEKTRSRKSRGTVPLNY